MGLRFLPVSPWQPVLAISGLLSSYEVLRMICWFRIAHRKSVAMCYGPLDLPAPVSKRTTNKLTAGTPGQQSKIANQMSKIPKTFYLRLCIFSFTHEALELFTSAAAAIPLAGALMRSLYY